METVILNDLKSSRLDMFNEYLIQIDYILYDLISEYPNFIDWMTKVKYELDTTSRKILLKVYKGEVVGISILKDTLDEKKICTFRIVDKYKRLGIGTSLMNDSLKMLDCKDPIITVSEKRISEFGSFLLKFGFVLTRKVNSMYIDNVTEYIFNSSKRNHIQEIELNNECFITN